MKEKLKCPHCESLRHTILCLTSNPPKFEYQCSNCLWGVHYFDREDSALPITQMELRKIYDKKA